MKLLYRYVALKDEIRAFRAFFSWIRRAMYNVNIIFYSELLQPVATNLSETNSYSRLLRQNYSTALIVWSETLINVAAFLRVINCSRARITVRANIFPENAGRSLYSLFPRPHFSRFSVMRTSADEIAELSAAKARRWLRCRAGNLFAHFYLRGMRDRVNRRVNRICSCPIPKEAYGCGIVTGCLAISLSLSTV